LLPTQIRSIAKALAKDIGRAEFSGRTITLKIKYANYQTITRAYTPGTSSVPVWIMRYRDILECVFSPPLFLFKR
jgi:hypothetical protein